MSTIRERQELGNLPRVALLTPRWGGVGEAAWALRQVLGALALTSDVHIITPQGARERVFMDGVFTVHEMASASLPSLNSRRDLLLMMLRDQPALPTDERRELDTVLDEGQQQWEALAEPLRSVQADLVVLADHREVGAARLARRVAPDIPIVLVPMAGRHAQPEDAHFRPILDSAACAIVFTEAEAALIRRASPALDVHHVGLPLAANPSVQREPNTFVGDKPYALVLTSAPFGAANWSTTLSTLLQLGFPETGVAVAASDRLVMFRQGEERQAGGVERGSDLLRLLAWATVTVDLRPGALYGRRAIEALLYGSPIVVPANSRAREHAELGGGGLWFDGPGDLFWCVEAALDGDVHEALSRQGREHAEKRYSGTQSFVERVNEAVSKAG